MNDIFARIVLGHLVGDYLLQSNLHKSDSGWRGLATCVIHCLIYTAAVCLFLWTINPLIIALIFLSHFPIDRWSLGGAWLKLIQGRTFEAAYASTSPYREFDIAFTSLIYTIVDNTLHLLLLYLVLRFVL